MRECSVACLSWKHERFSFHGDAYGIHPCHQPRCRRLHIALDARHLPRKEKPVICLKLEGWTQMTRCVHECIPVHHAVAQKLRAREPRNHPEHALLLRPLEPCLEADDVVDRPLRIVLPQLDDGVGTLSRLRMLKPYGLQRSIEQCRLSAQCHDFDGHTALEEDLLFKVVRLCCFCRGQRRPKSIILCLVHRAVDVRRLTLPIAGGTIRCTHINARRTHQRRCGIVEIERIIAEES